MKIKKQKTILLGVTYALLDFTQEFPIEFPDLIVMETGGYLSHGAIVAREYGLPAVVNLPGILNSLKDGEVISVDGDTGRIRRQSGPKG